MPMKFFTKEFWSARSIWQQVAHFTQGFVYTLLFRLMYPRAWFLGAIVGFLVECYQFLFKDDFDPRLEDRLRDWLFWALGGALTLLI